MTDGSSAQRERIIVELLRLHQQPFAFTSLQGARGDDGAVPVRSHEPHCRFRVQAGRCTCWLRSLDEVHRCLRELRKRDRGLWYAVTERYVMAVRQPRTVRVVRYEPRPPENWEVIGLVNKLDLDSHGTGDSRLLVESWRGGVDLSRAAAGVRWLSEAFVGSPMLPVEVAKAA